MRLSKEANLNMREAEFKIWLEESGARSEAGRTTRTQAVKVIERNLPALGMPWDDLDVAWAADRFDALRARLKEVRQDARNGGDDFRILMPQSDNPHNRLSSWSSWLGQYGRFLAGEPARPISDADLIRQYVIENYIEPARDEDRHFVDVPVLDLGKALNMEGRAPNICQALTGTKLREMAEVPQPDLDAGTAQSTSALYRFHLNGRRINRTR